MRIALPGPNQKERMDILRLLASNVLKYNDKHTTNHALDALAIQIKPRDGDEKPGAIAQAAANWATTETEKMFKGNSNGCASVLLCFRVDTAQLLL